MDVLIDALCTRAAALLPGEGDYALHARQTQRAGQLHDHLQAAGASTDLLIIAEDLRLARGAIDALTGQASTEDMLDRLFSGFCIGK